MKGIAFILILFLLFLPACLAEASTGSGDNLDPPLAGEVVTAPASDNRGTEAESTEEAGIAADSADSTTDMSPDDTVEDAKWQQIMDLWQTIQNDLTVHDPDLPDGLDETDALCLVVLGFQLNRDGSMQDELIGRLKVALAASQKYPNALIACTGGHTAADDPAATEAESMARWLIDHGVQADRVIVEDHALSTAENAVNTFDILEKQYPRVKQLAVISSDYHIAKGMLLFGAEAIIRDSDICVVGNAAYRAPTNALSNMLQDNAMVELSVIRMRLLKAENNGSP